MTTTDATERVTAILKFIATYQAEHQASPTRAVIAKATGISPHTIAKYLMRLRDTGMIRNTHTDTRPYYVIVDKP